MSNLLYYCCSPRPQPFWSVSPWGLETALVCRVMLCHLCEIHTAWPRAAFLSIFLLAALTDGVYFWSSSSPCRRLSLLQIRGLEMKSEHTGNMLILEGFLGLFFFSRSHSQLKVIHYFSAQKDWERRVEPWLIHCLLLYNQGTLC